MKLLGLTLSNVRKFAGQTATISGLGDGVNVVAQANEFGKSTFFDALHALFFLKYGAATRDIKALQPRSGGPVRVAAQIALPEGDFTIEKTWLAQKRARVLDAGGAVIALDDEAEVWIAQLMGTGLEGPAGLLWVRQGQAALEPAGTMGADKSERERLLGARRSLLSSVAGEIDMVTGGRRMDRVIEAAQAALSRLATGTGRPLKNGPWGEAEAEMQALSARHTELLQLCSDLARALEQRREVLHRLAVLEAPGAQDRLDQGVATAQAALETAQAHALRQSQAESEEKLRALELESAQQHLDGLLAAAQALQAAQSERGGAQADAAQAQGAADSAQEALAQAQTAMSQAQQTVEQHQAARDALQSQALRASAREALERAQKQLAQVLDKRSELEAAQARLAAQRVTPQALALIEQAHATLTRAQSDARARSVQIEIRYDGDARVHSAGEALAEGQHVLPRRQRFDLPGIGHLIVDPSAAAVDMQAVEAAQTDFDAALAAVHMGDIAAARRGAVAQRAAADAVALLENLTATLAPEGVAALQNQVAQAQAALDALHPADALPATDPQEVARALNAALDALHVAQIAHDTARANEAREATALALAQARAQRAQAAVEAAQAAYGDAADFETRKAQAARAVSLAQTAAGDARAASEGLRAAAPDLATCMADLARAKSAAENARAERAQLQTRTADLNATIRARAEDGVEEKRDEVAGMLRRATERAARLAEEAAGLGLLLDTLRAQRGAAQEAYFGPVQAELAPLLSLLHDTAALSFDPATLLPQAMARGGMDETVESLSGGTQEQIAILTRLAFARLFARQGNPVPVILDDALVYSDDSRIVAMFTALHRVAHDQQVIVFSCRQMAFEQLGGTKPRIEITAMA